MNIRTFDFVLGAGIATVVWLLVGLVVMSLSHEPEPKQIFVPGRGRIELDSQCHIKSAKNLEIIGTPGSCGMLDWMDEEKAP